MEVDQNQATTIKVAAEGCFKFPGTGVVCEWGAREYSRTEVTVESVPIEESDDGDGDDDDDDDDEEPGVRSMKN